MNNTKKTYNAADVAKYFIYLASNEIVGDSQEREGITNLKLQKILYFAQAYYLTKFKKPLFKNVIEAWEYGPVITSVYNGYKKHKNKPIIIGKEETIIEEKDKAFLREVWNIFGDYSASKLINIVHSHTPWKKAYKSSSKKISNKSISDYYTPLFNK